MHRRLPGEMLPPHRQLVLEVDVSCTVTNEMIASRPDGDVMKRSSCSAEGQGILCRVMISSETPEILRCGSRMTRYAARDDLVSGSAARDDMHTVK
jgi:hypothetical protein